MLKMCRLCKKICRISKKHAKYKEGLTNVQQLSRICRICKKYAKNTTSTCKIYVKNAVHANHATNLQSMPLHRRPSDHDVGPLEELLPAESSIST